MNLFYYETALGRLGIAEQSGAVRYVLFDKDAPPEGAELFESGTLKEAAGQIKAYLTGGLNEFSIPISPRGTPFMRLVWDKLCAVPYGSTATYKQIAEAAGSPKAARAVGMANNRNPIPIIIPCHRIVGAAGKLTGYRGGLEMKRRLLELESAHALL